MPNPFPGMDPYLEGWMWPSVHNDLINEISMQLSDKLRPKYITRKDLRVFIASPDPLEVANVVNRLPDVGIYATAQGASRDAGAPTNAPLVLDALVPQTIEQTFIEIRDVAERRLVTAIEVLSMTNKRGDGLEEYRRKRNEMLAGDAHFLEIDFLRLGDRFPVAEPLPSTPYFVFLSRANRRAKVEIWPIALESPLPVVNVPLLAGDPDVKLDLQTAFQTMHERYSYDQPEEHRGPLSGLSHEQIAWAEERLHSAGLR
jgi:hypothetical protein